jgi:hypothetical protein
MPNFTTGNFKQKNKPFKGKKKASRAFKGIDLKEPSSKLNKKISKNKSNALNIEGKSSNKKRRNQKIKNIRKNQQKVKVKMLKEQDRLKKIQMINRSSQMSLDMKTTLLKSLKLLSPTKIILLMDTNGNNSFELLGELEKLFGGERGAKRFSEDVTLSPGGQTRAWNYLYIGDNAKLKQIKGTSFLFVECAQDSVALLDLCKVADVLMPVCSTRRVNFQELNTNPKDSLNAIDDWGLQSIIWLRSQGILPVQPVVTHITEAPSNKTKNLKFYLDRLFKEEFTTENSTLFIEKPNDLTMMMLRLWGIKVPDLIWRRKRGYMLVEKVSIQENKVILQGQSRGGGFSLNELVHLTGIGDFCPKGAVVCIGKNHQLIRETHEFSQPDPMDIFASGESPVEVKGTETEQMGLEIEQNEEEEDDLANLMSEVQGMNVEDAGFEFEEELESEKEDEDLSFDEGNMKEQKMTRRREVLRLHGRKEDEKEFQDEVEFEAQVQLRDRLKKYRYLNSFNRDVWNKYDRIPDFYKRLFKFEKMEQIEKIVKIKHSQDLIAPEGAHIAFVFENANLSQLLQERVRMDRPLILSSLFKHERKMTLSHHIVKVHNLVGHENYLESKKEFLVQNGFRRFRSNVMFSSIIRESPNHKLLRKISIQNGWCLMSHYTPLYFKPNNVLVFQEEHKSQDLLNLSGSQMQLSLIGKNFKHDLFKVLLKRIILTGYPLKTKRKKAIIKFMFFDPQDAEFFKRNEIYSRDGMRGKIQETVGMHGLIKCHFNGHLSSSDTVCMNLYKRVFPKFLY